MQSIKVLFENPSSSLHNPVLTVFADICQNLDHDCFELHMALERCATGSLRSADRRMLITRWNIALIDRTQPNHRSPLSCVSSAARVGASVVALAQYVRKHGINIIHVDCTPSGGAIGLAISSLTRIPLLVHFHELVGRYPGTPKRHSLVRRLIEHATVRHADRLVAVSKFAADQIRAAGITRTPVDVVPNGIDLSRFHPDINGTRMRREYGIGFDEPLALQLGRVYEQKRPQDFVRAFALARRQLPKLRGLLIGWDDPGYPPGKADIRRLCEAQGLGDSLVIAEARPEAPELMAAADILVSPGLEEAGGPLVVAEAMAAGKPVIGARSGGTMETVVDGETGFLVPPKSPAALADKLALLASNQELRHQMGVAGRRRAERELDGRLMAARFARIYEELADAHPPSM